MSKLKDYIREAATLECQMYAQRTLMARLDKTINTLGRPRKQEKPSMPELYLPDIIKFGFYFTGAFTIIIGIYLVIVCFVEGIDLLLAELSGMIFLWIVLLLLFLYCKHRHDKEIQENKDRYNAAMMKYRSEVKNDNDRVQKELAVKKNLVQQRELVKAGCWQTKKALDSLYELDIIHQKYRSIVPITSFYDYFDTGICTELTGFGGAYARYEEDLRFNRIEGKLDVIISKLDQVLANQQMLAGLLRESNATLRRIEAQNDAMVRDVEHIKENSELTAYNTKCAAQSNAVMEHIAFYRAMKTD